MKGVTVGRRSGGNEVLTLALGRFAAARFMGGGRSRIYGESGTRGE